MIHLLNWVTFHSNVRLKEGQGSKHLPSPIFGCPIPFHLSQSSVKFEHFFFDLNLVFIPVFECACFFSQFFHSKKWERSFPCFWYLEGLVFPLDNLTLTSKWGSVPKLPCFFHVSGSELTYGKSTLRTGPGSCCNCGKGFFSGLCCMIPWNVVTGGVGNDIGNGNRCWEGTTWMVGTGFQARPKIEISSHLLNHG